MGRGKATAFLFCDVTSGGWPSFGESYPRRHIGRTEAVSRAFSGRCELAGLVQLPETPREACPGIGTHVVEEDGLSSVLGRRFKLTFNSHS